MGYKKKSDIYKLAFEDEYEGMEVRARSMPLGKFMRMAKLIDMDVNAMSSEDIDNMDELFGLFADALVEWNITDEDDNPVPATKEGLYDLDLREAMVIIVSYTSAIGGVPDPLDRKSTDGEQSPEAGIPMQVDT